MSSLTFLTFLCGPPAYRPVANWHPLAAVLAAAGVVVAGQGAPILVLMLLQGGAQPAGSLGRDAALGCDTEVALLLLAGQAALALLTLGVARLHGMRLREALYLAPPEGGAWAVAYAMLLMLPLLVVFNGIAYLLSPEGYLADFRQFARLAQVPQPWMSFLAVALGAPLWEELLFRGFLLAPLSRAMGFWPAAVAVSAGWAALHLGYSLAGLAEVFLIGLYFAWLLRRTGSLWVPIACHTAYNAALFIAMRYLA